MAIQAIAASSDDDYRSHSDAPATWQDFFASAYGDAAELQRTSVPEDGMELATAAWPLVEAACIPVGERLITMVSDSILGSDDLPAIYTHLASTLWQSLFTLVSRTMVLELAAAQKSSLLDETSANAGYDTFVSFLAEPDFAAAILSPYPDLCERLVTVASNWSEATAEMLDRLRSDNDLIHLRLFDTATPAKITAIKPSAGDTHRHGRAVALVNFDNGETAVYKPRPLQAEIAFGKFAGWFNSRSGEDLIANMRTLDRGDYGWCAFVRHGEAAGNAGLRRYYRRLGALMAVSRVLGLTDLHFENLVAAGEFPVVIDLETLFHPANATMFPDAAPTPADRRLARIADQSAQASGLLPIRLPRSADSNQMNVAGMSDVEGIETPFEMPVWEDAGTGDMRMVNARQKMSGQANIPMTNGNRVSPEHFRATILAGFRTAYRILQAEQENLLAADGPIARFADIPVRVVVRPTQRYLDILGSSTHPELLSDPAARHAWLMQALPVDGRFACLAPLRDAELEALKRNDVPCFETIPASRDLGGCDGQTCRDILPECGFDAAREAIGNLGPRDLQRQLRLIATALTTAETAAPLPQPEAVLSDTGDDLQTAAERIVRNAVRDVCDAAVVEDGSAAWFTTVEGDGGTLVSKQAELDLYSGLPGIALFLGHAGRSLDDNRATHIGEAALRTITRHIEGGRHEHLGIGGYNGLGGLVFALHDLSTLYPHLPVDPALETVLSSLESMDTDGKPLELIDGVAGTILALDGIEGARAIQEKLLRTAIRRVETIDNDPLLGATGLAHGPAGLRLALSVAARTFASSALGSQALAAIRALDARTAEHVAGCACHADPVTWCGGEAGLMLAESFGRGHKAETVFAALQNGTYRDDSLCHGSLGALLALRSGNAISVARHNSLARAILAQIENRGPRCGTIGGEFSPALMDGMSGIGFAALSFLTGTALPSILTLGNATGIHLSTKTGD